MISAARGGGVIFLRLYREAQEIKWHWWGYWQKSNSGAFPKAKSREEDFDRPLVIKSSFWMIPWELRQSAVSPILSQRCHWTKPRNLTKKSLLVHWSWFCALLETLRRLIAVSTWNYIIYEFILFRIFNSKIIFWSGDDPESWFADFSVCNHKFLDGI